MFEVFMKAELTSLKVAIVHGGNCCPKCTLIGRTSSRESSDSLKNLLISQKSLKKLAIRSLNIKHSKLFETIFDEENIKFKLDELSLNSITWNNRELLNDDLNEFNYLVKFMKLHCKTIETLELVGIFPDFVFEFAVSKFKNLKTLHLKTFTIPTEAAFYDRLETNESVKTLTLADISYSDAAIKHLFKHLPNIDHLNIMVNCFYDTLKSVAENLKKLKSLKVKSFNGPMSNQLNFPSLESLSIGTVKDIEWDLFTREAPAIKHLHIDNFDSFNLNIKTILQNYKMESLTINCLAKCDTEFFDTIRKFGSSLKSLNLTKESLTQDMSEVADIPGLRFSEGLIIDPLATRNGAWNDTKYNYVSDEEDGSDGSDNDLISYDVDSDMNDPY